MDTQSYLYSNRFDKIMSQHVIITMHINRDYLAYEFLWKKLFMFDDILPEHAIIRNKNVKTMC